MFPAMEREREREREEEVFFFFFAYFVQVRICKTFDLVVASSREDPGNGRGSGFDTTPARPPADVLNLLVRPIGDYSTYMLGTGPLTGFDPVFAEVAFKFRPGCFTTNCAPDWTPAPKPSAR